ncbi:DUF4158 domain-containing protein [Streptomyces sp. NPDC058612]|uniref:DUF4158 domain-containing protein n=1 Tax=Streptomyces sp. NPDC058612 TaxID=3346555 RepID=UPI00365D943F
MNIHEPAVWWTLSPQEASLAAAKRGPMRLGFAVLLKFHTHRGRFPRDRAELPDEAVKCLARQLGLPASDLDTYPWTGRSVEYHRGQIREYRGFRECSVADATALTAHLADIVARSERTPERVHEELLERCRAQRIEPPAPGRCDRIVASALHAAEEALTAQVCARLTPEATQRIVSLVAARTGASKADVPGGQMPENSRNDPPLLRMIKEPPAGASLQAILAETDKLLAVRSIGLPRDLFTGIAPPVLAAWSTRGATESPSRLRDHPAPLRVALLAAFLHVRERELTDTLADLLISLSGLMRSSPRAV